MDIYAYIKAEENRYNTIPIPVVENYEWHMAKHVKLTTLYLNSQFETGNKDLKPFRNIVLPAVNLQHRAVEFAVKDIEFFIDDSEDYYKAFLVRKFHEKWARENNLAGFLDDMTEQYTDYGGTLIKKTKSAVPLRVEFQQLAFCDQTDILGGPICIKHQFTPDGLKDMEAMKWGDKEYGATCTIDELIMLAKNEKSSTQINDRKIQTPNKYIEVYELHGVLPASYLYDPEDKELDIQETDYIGQMQIVAFYKKEGAEEKQGVTLFKAKEKEGIFKFFKRDPIFGRALGRGAVEELFDPQVWVNYSAIQQKELLDQASKVIYQTADKQFTTRNQTTQAENGDVWIYEDGKPVAKVDTGAPNMVAFENALKEWQENAKEISASYDTISGADSKSGMPFRLGLMLNQEAHSLHKYRKGKLGGIFLPEIYKDWIIPEIRKELSNDQVFSSMLTLEEMDQIAESVVNYAVNEQIKKKILDGGIIASGEIPALQQNLKDMFYKKGNQKFFKIYKDELKDLPLDVSVNITNEEKDRAHVAEALSSVFAQLVPILGANPGFFEQNPVMSKLFNEVLSASGLNPLSYNSITKKAPPTQVQAPTKVAPAPQQKPELATA